MTSKPNLFLVAAPRSGSTQLANWLSESSEIYLPPIKEPNFFSSEEFPEEYVKRTHLNDIDPEYYVRSRLKSVHQFAVFRDIHDYEYLYKDIRVPLLMDGSTTYLHHKNTAQKIKNYSPDARIIILIRHPVDRLISHYHLALRTGRVRGSLHKEIKMEMTGEKKLFERYLIRQSLYTDAVNNYLDVFPGDKIKVIFFEKLIKHKLATLGEILDFLNVPRTKIFLKETNRNASVAPRFETVNYFINQIGLKTFMRRTIPKPIKRLIKPIYFSKSKALVDYASLRLIGDIIEEDYHNFCNIMPLAEEIWNSPGKVISNYLDQ